MKKQEIIDQLKAKGVMFKEDLTVKQLGEILKASEAVKQEETQDTSTKESVKVDKDQGHQEQSKEDFVKISKKDWQDVQNQLKMLYNVADKGRIFNYENQQQKDKKPTKVKLSVYDGQIITGWRTLKDELIKDSRTGATIGEIQEYELSLLNEEGKTTYAILDGYIAFSNARYDKRIEVEVVGKKEDWDGTLTFNVSLPNGNIISLDSKFVN